jgi:pimeloyl-ACP methyl ester carboxylesterase
MAVATVDRPAAQPKPPTSRGCRGFLVGRALRQTIIISGGADLLTPPSHARDLAAAIPGATHLHLPMAGHMLLHEAPHAVTDAISRTIATRISAHPLPKVLTRLPGQRNSEHAKTA